MFFYRYRTCRVPLRRREPLLFSVCRLSFLFPLSSVSGRKKEARQIDSFFLRGWGVHCIETTLKTTKQQKNEKNKQKRRPVLAGLATAAQPARPTNPFLDVAVIDSPAATGARPRVKVPSASMAPRISRTVSDVFPFREKIWARRSRRVGRNTVDHVLIQNCSMS